MTLRPRTSLLALLLVPALALGVVACGGDDDGGGGDESAADGGGDGGGCPDGVFDGELAREADPSNPDHEPVTLSGDEIVSGLAVSSGSSYTVYLASYELDEADLGTTLVAPEGEVLTTMNLPADGSADATNVFLTIDSGAGAISSGVVTPDVSVDVIEAGDEQLCLTVDINKEFETVEGTFSVPVAAA